MVVWIAYDLYSTILIVPPDVLTIFPSRAQHYLFPGGRIDHSHHFNNAHRALVDTLAFEDAVIAALEITRSDDTLMVVTSDHSHVFAFGGYPKRGNPIFGQYYVNKFDRKFISILCSSILVDNLTLAGVCASRNE